MANQISLANASLPLHEVLEAEFVALHGELPADYPSPTDAETRLEALWAAVHALKGSAQLSASRAGRRFPGFPILV